MMRKLALTLLAATLGACSNPDMKDLKAFVSEVQERPPGGVTPAPQLVEAETFLYVPGGRRDPFEPEQELVEQGVEEVDDGIQPDFNRRREELESYSLDTLRMVGTLEQEEQTWGLVRTKDGTIHRVAVGNHMGINHGKIVEIREDKIRLVELLKIGQGYQEQEAALSLGDGGS